MPKDWKEVKKELDKATEDIFLVCPDEIKRFHYGIITHSDAGKHSINQYFGHLVHAYAGYYVWPNEIGAIIRLTMEGKLDIKQVKEVFNALIMTLSPFFAEYAGQYLQAKYTKMVFEAWDSVTSKEELVELLNSYLAFISRLYWWIHWYFPWGIGPVLCQRLSTEDVKEIVRLSQPSKS